MLRFESGRSTYQRDFPKLPTLTTKFLVFLLLMFRFCCCVFLFFFLSNERKQTQNNSLHADHFTCEVHIPSVD